MTTTLLGAVKVSLKVKTSAKDTDFVVRLSDLYPDGRTSMLLGDNIVRMRWRNSDAVESTTVPGQEYVIELTMWQLCYVFNPGHSLRVVVTSSNYPRYDANPNNGLLVYQGGDIYNATNTILFGGDSFVDVPTVDLAQLPEYKIL